MTLGPDATIDKPSAPVENAPTSPTQVLLASENTGATPGQTNQLKEGVRSFIDGTDPKILAQRFRNMGLINNAERDQILALAPEKQQEALVKMRDQADQVRAIASEASRSGIISHAQFMALYHSANGAIDASGKAPKYSLQERTERTKALQEALAKMKKGGFSAEQAKSDYLNFKHNPGASSAPKPNTTSNPAPTEGTPSSTTHLPTTSPTQTPTIPATTTPVSTPVVPSTSKTPPDGKITTPPTSQPNPEEKPLTPEQQQAFTQIGQTNFFTRVQGPAYDFLFSSYSQEPGIQEPKSKAGDYSILVSNRELIKKFHQDVTQLIFANDEYLRTALAGKNIELNFHHDLKQVALAPGEKVAPGQVFLGVSVVTPGGGSMPAIYLDPRLAKDHAKGILILLHELTHVARRLGGSTLSKKEEEIATIERTLEIAPKILEKVTDPQIRRYLASHIRTEEYRLSQIKKQP